MLNRGSATWMYNSCSRKLNLRYPPGFLGSLFLLIDLDEKSMTAPKFRAVNTPPSTELVRGLEQKEIDGILAAATPADFRPNP